MGRHSIRLAACAALAALAAACWPPDGVDPLVVASDFSNPPFASWQADEPEGLEPDLARELARDLGRPVQWSKLPFETLLDAVAEGKADIVIATTGITPERAERVAFSRPYFRTAICVVGRAGEDEPGRLSQLAGRPVGASRGTTSERALRLTLPAANAVLDREEQASWETMLRDGSIDAAVMDCPDADELEQASGGSLQRFPVVLTEELYACAVAPGNTELLSAVDGTLARLEAEGTLERWARERGLRP